MGNVQGFTLDNIELFKKLHPPITRKNRRFLRVIGGCNLLDITQLMGDLSPLNSVRFSTHNLHPLKIIFSDFYLRQRGHFHAASVHNYKTRSIYLFIFKVIRRFILGWEFVIWATLIPRNCSN